MAMPQAPRGSITAVSGVCVMRQKSPLPRVRLRGLGLEFMASAVEIDFLVPERQRHSALEFAPAHAERTLVEPAGLVDVLDREDDMIDPVDGELGHARR